MPKLAGERALLTGMVAATIAALQPWTMLAIGDADVSSMAALASESGLARRMFAAMLAFMPAMFAAYWIATRIVATNFPVTASFMAFAFALWFALELLPRSFDLIVVHGRWLAEYTTAGTARRSELEKSYTDYRDALHAVGFVRRHALLVGQLCLAAAVWRSGLAGRLLSIALAFSVVRLMLGSLALYGGFTSLYALADPLYFVTASTIFPLLAAWLWRQRRRERETSAS